MIDLRHGDCLDVLKTLVDNSVDSIVTDPPYGLSFMGKKWDYDVPSEEIWRECLRVLKPGGYLLAFAGTRTQHRMAIRIEDAGFEIRDMIAWVYGSGFPKSLDVSKAIGRKAGVTREVVGFDPVKAKRTVAVGTPAYGDYKGQTGDITEPATENARQWQGWGTALKPALEPITVARKPLVGTVAENILTHGTGAINIDESRVQTSDKLSNHSRTADAAISKGKYGDSKEQTTHVTTGQEIGRWPANLIHDGSDEVLATFPNAPGQQGDLINHDKDRQSPSGCFSKMSSANDHIARVELDKSASRFFYCAKASKKDREENNNHPTVKPTELMRYLCKLVTQPNGVILDPFMGSGSTGKAAKLENFSFIGIERESEYIEISKARIENAVEKSTKFKEKKKQEPIIENNHIDKLFDFNTKESK